MAYSFQVKNPAYPDGYEFEIPGLGLCKNGEVVKIDPDEEYRVELYRQAGFDWPESEKKLVIDAGVTLPPPDAPDEEEQAPTESEVEA